MRLPRLSMLLLTLPLLENMPLFLWSGPVPQTKHPASKTELAQADAEAKALPEGLLLAFRSVAPKGAKETLSLFASVAYSPDGKMLATGGYNSPLRLWDSITGKEIRRLEGGDGIGGPIAFAPDGKVLASSFEDNIVRLWSPATGKQVGELRGHTDVVRVLAFSPDGKIMATAGKDRTIRIWNTSSRKLVSTLTGCSGMVHCLCYSPDGKALASMSADGKVQLWDLSSGKEIQSWEGYFVAFSPTSNALAMIGEESSVWIRDAATGKMVLHLLGVGERPFHVGWLAYSPDGRLLAGSSSTELLVWETSTGKLILYRQRKDFPFPAGSLAFSPDGRGLAVAGQKDSVLVWDLTGWGRREPPQRPDLTGDELTALWSDLKGDDAAKAHRAIWSLVATPKQAAPLLKESLRPVVDKTSEAQRWVEQLDDEQFAVRQKAAAELEKFEKSAVPALRKKLTEQPSAEIRRQIERLLEKAESAERKERTERAVAVLEHIGTPDAQEVLKAWASGSESARLTREAKAALDRLAKRAALKH